MSNIFAILMGIAMLATVVALLVGIFSMARGGDAARQYGNKIMWLRVYSQGAAVLFFALALLARGN
ncbi:MAG: twin transmembrane helix small protein [Bdellovibrionales bacterium]